METKRPKTFKVPKRYQDNFSAAAAKVLNVTPSFSARFIRVGAYIQFAVIALGLIPPLGRWTMRLIHTIDSPEVRESLSHIVLGWIVGAPIIGTILYTRLPIDQKAGTEGLLLLFWWISLIAMVLVAFSLGNAF